MVASNLTWAYDSGDLQSESITVIQWHGLFSILLITVCCALAIINTAGKSLIIYHVRYKAPKRPMNTMTSVGLNIKIAEGDTAGLTQAVGVTWEHCGQI